MVDVLLSLSLRVVSRIQPCQIAVLEGIQTHILDRVVVIIQLAEPVVRGVLDQLLHRIFHVLLNIRGAVELASRFAHSSSGISGGRVGLGVHP